MRTWMHASDVIPDQFIIVHNKASQWERRSFIEETSRAWVCFSLLTETPGCIAVLHWWTAELRSNVRLHDQRKFLYHVDTSAALLWVYITLYHRLMFFNNAWFLGVLQPVSTPTSCTHTYMPFSFQHHGENTQDEICKINFCESICGTL